MAKDLGLDDPAVVQGMYIFKQPKIGTEGERPVSQTFSSRYGVLAGKCVNAENSFPILAVMELCGTFIICNY